MPVNWLPTHLLLNKPMGNDQIRHQNISARQPQLMENDDGTTNFICFIVF